MEPVETILVPISKAAGCTIICEAELSHDCTCRQTARAAIAALEDDGWVVVREAVLRRSFSAGMVWQQALDRPTVSPPMELNMEPVEIITSALDGLADYDVHGRGVKQRAAATILKAIEDAGLCVVPKVPTDAILDANAATPTPSRTEEGDGW